MQSDVVGASEIVGTSEGGREGSPDGAKVLVGTGDGALHQPFTNEPASIRPAPSMPRYPSSFESEISIADVFMQLMTSA